MILLYYIMSISKPRTRYLLWWDYPIFGSILIGNRNSDSKVDLLVYLKE